MANLAALSGPAARMALVLLLAGEPLRLKEAGVRAGITRRDTRTEAATELEALGLARRQPGSGRTVLLVPSYLVLAVDRRPTEEERRGREEGMEIDRLEDTSSIPIDYLSIYREASQTTGGDLAEAASPLVPSDQAVINAAESVATVSAAMPQKVLHYISPESAALPQLVGISTESAALASPISPVSAASPSGVSTVSAALDDGEDDLLLPVEMADAMERGEATHQRTSPYIRRRNAQVNALQGLWRGTFKSASTPTRESMVALLRITDDSALVVAEMMQDVGERIAGGLKVQSLYGYLRKTIENRVREEKERPAASASTSRPRPNRPIREDDPIELAEPDDAYRAQQAEAKRMAKLLWGDD